MTAEIGIMIAAGGLFGFALGGLWLLWRALRTVTYSLGGKVYRVKHSEIPAIRRAWAEQWRGTANTPLPVPDRIAPPDRGHSGW